MQLTKIFNITLTSSIFFLRNFVDGGFHAGLTQTKPLHLRLFQPWLLIFLAEKIYSLSEISLKNLVQKVIVLFSRIRAGKEKTQ